MSSKKTPNLGLHEWVPDDYVQMEEFNDNFKKLDDHAKQTENQIGGIRSEVTELKSDITQIDQTVTQNRNEVMSHLAEITSELDNLHLHKVGMNEITRLSNEIAEIVSYNGDGTKDTEIINARTGVFGDSSATLKERIDNGDYNFLLANHIEGTRQSVTFNADGTPQKVHHRLSDGSIARIDNFSYDGNIIVEERVLTGGKQLTYIYNLTTFETIVLDQSYQDLLPYNLETYEGWNGAIVDGDALLFKGYRDISYHRQFENGKTYGLLLTVSENNLNEYLRSRNNFTGVYERLVESGEVGHIKRIITSKLEGEIDRFNLGTLSSETGDIKIKDIRLFELKENSQIKYDFEKLNAEQLNEKYPKEAI